MPPKRKRTSTGDDGSRKKAKTGGKPKPKPKPGGSKGGKGGKPKPKPKPKPQVDRNKGASEPDPIDDPVTWQSSPSKWRQNLSDNHGKRLSAGLSICSAGLVVHPTGSVMQHRRPQVYDGDCVKKGLMYPAGLSYIHAVLIKCSAGFFPQGSFSTE